MVYVASQKRAKYTLLKKSLKKGMRKNMLLSWRTQGAYFAQKQGRPRVYIECPGTHAGAGKYIEKETYGNNDNKKMKKKISDEEEELYKSTIVRRQIYVLIFDNDDHYMKIFFTYYARSSRFSSILKYFDKKKRNSQFFSF